MQLPGTVGSSKQLPLVTCGNWQHAGAQLAADAEHSAEQNTLMYVVSTHPKATAVTARRDTPQNMMFCYS
jgi:hypothetical protein